MTGLVPSVHMEAPRNVQKESFRNKSFKKELQGEKECQGLHEDEICRKRASGIRASKKGFQGEMERQGLREDETRRKQLQE